MASLHLLMLPQKVLIWMAKQKAPNVSTSKQQDNYSNAAVVEFLRRHHLLSIKLHKEWSTFPRAYKSIKMFLCHELIRCRTAGEWVFEGLR